MKANSLSVQAGDGKPPLTELRPGLFRIRDTCNVYVFRPGPSGTEAVCVDFGSGMVLDLLDQMSVSRITHVLMTHHHRDQAQGLPRAVKHGIEVWVPPVEQELFCNVEKFWASRRVRNDYVLLTDRFSLLESVPIQGTVPEYRRAQFGPVSVNTWPTPGHTPGSVSYLVEFDRELFACTGDLIYAPGKVWSLAATQWSYTGNEGPQMTLASTETLLHHAPGPISALLPSHGAPMFDPITALTDLGNNMERYLNGRRHEGVNPTRARLANPFEHVTENLLVNTSSEARSWVLRSRTGEALFIDYGYDMTTWFPLGGPRHSQRPLLSSIPALAQYGITKVTAALATHYHDDHVAGMNLLRDVTGVQIWAAENVAPVMEDPLALDLPCQWYEPTPVDKVLPLGEPIQWNEYTITAHPLPGHTLFAAAYEFEVDGKRVLAVGDQQDGAYEPGKINAIGNYQYRNRFRIHDYQLSASLYRLTDPDIFIAGHWEPRKGGPEFLAAMDELGERILEHHAALLPGDELDMPADGVVARLSPYLHTASPGQRIDWEVSVYNPLSIDATAHMQLTVPTGWSRPDAVSVPIPARGNAIARVFVDVPEQLPPLSPSVVTLEVSVGELHLGQHTESLIEVKRDTRIA